MGCVRREDAPITHTRRAYGLTDPGRLAYDVVRNVVGRTSQRGLPEVTVPLGAYCNWCNEAILPPSGGEPGDSGVIYASGLAVHAECFIRMAVGSVGHQLGLCRCSGGPGWLNDPPKLSMRAAAKAAVKLAASQPESQRYRRNPWRYTSDNA